jgi:hypothetical protein
LQFLLNAEVDRVPFMVATVRRSHVQAEFIKGRSINQEHACAGGSGS